MLPKLRRENRNTVCYNETDIPLQVNLNGRKKVGGIYLINPAEHSPSWESNNSAGSMETPAFDVSTSNISLV